ncbi:iron-sulfur cluster assembly scaffold protein [Planctomicrobium sp. SH668]|uniref:iron-sulfur cluster assembly scaffold protein n=1 Tax=Planctomicrobium sp. SH668 TaxID=3448126 RepID=UPI003F5C62D4
MNRFSEVVMEHFTDPQNRGELQDPTHVGVYGLPGQGPFFILQLQVLDDVIERARFQCNACGVTIACGSIVTELLTGSLLSNCQDLTREGLEAQAGGLPPDKQHCAETAIQAIRNLMEIE